MKIQYKKLVAVVVIFLVVFLAAVFSFYTLGNIKKEQNAQLLQAESGHAEAQKRLNSADKDLRLYRKYEDRYQKFEKMGLFNKEDRADLTENIVKAGKKIGVFDLTMQLTPQVTMDDYTSNENYLSDAQWRRSEQKISFSALHEIDALNFFKALDWDKRLQQFETCEFASKDIVLSPRAKNITVSCNLNWSTLYLLPKEDRNAP